jgi:hypothetical protein
MEELQKSRKAALESIEKSRADVLMKFETGGTRCFGVFGPRI